MPRTSTFVAPALLAASLLTAQPAAASEIGTTAHKFGLGLALGGPTGISGKYYPGGRRTAIEGVLGIYGNGWWGGGFYLHGTYLWHPDVLARDTGFELPWHVGIGGFVQDGYWGPWYDRGPYRGWNGVALGVRGQIGLDFDLEDVRLQISADVGANVGVGTYGGVFVAPGLYLTIRYFF